MDWLPEDVPKEFMLFFKTAVKMLLETDGVPNNIPSKEKSPSLGKFF